MPAIRSTAATKAIGMDGIKVIGVGCGGINAVNSLIRSGLDGVGCIAANPNIRELSRSLADHKIQLGAKLTQGLGTGGNPQVGYRAAMKSMEQINAAIGEAAVVVIAAGMGGGTGTGAAPVIARIAGEKGALTAGIVTTPFFFEGKKRRENAEAGIIALCEHVDSLVIIHNDSLIRLAPEWSSFRNMLEKADEVLCLAVKGIAGLIAARGIANLDCGEMKTVLAGLGHSKDATVTVVARGEIDGIPMLSLKKPLQKTRGRFFRKRRRAVWTTYTYWKH